MLKLLSELMNKNDDHRHSVWNCIEKKDVIYIEQEYDEQTNEAIRDNLPELTEIVRKAGYRFYYLPVEFEKLHLQDILGRYFPGIDKSDTLNSFETSKLVRMLFPDWDDGTICPSLLISKQRGHDPEIMQLDTHQNITEQFLHRFPPKESTPRRCAAPTSSDESALRCDGDILEKRVNQLKEYRVRPCRVPEEDDLFFIHKLESKENATFGKASAEITETPLSQEQQATKEIIAELRLRFGQAVKHMPVDLIIKMLLEDYHSKMEATPLHVTSDLRILLPEIDRQFSFKPQAKTLYLFFLRHPEGVNLKDLVDYREELMEIYCQLTNRFDDDTINSAIDSIIDSTNNNANVLLSRINGHIKEVISDTQLANLYCILGQRGDIKRISLPREKVTIDPYPA